MKFFLKICSFLNLFLQKTIDKTLIDSFVTDSIIFPRPSQKFYAE